MSTQDYGHLLRGGEWEPHPRRYYLACLRTVRVKLDLLGCKFAACVYIIAQIDPAEGTLAQELPTAPIDGGAWSCKSTEGKSISLSKYFPDSFSRGPIYNGLQAHFL